MAMAILLCAQGAFVKWREELLSPELWSGWEMVILNLLLTPGGKDFWKERCYLSGTSFREHIDNDIMKRTLHSDAKLLGAFPLGGVPA